MTTIEAIAVRLNAINECRIAILALADSAESLAEKAGLLAAETACAKLLIFQDGIRSADHLLVKAGRPQAKV